MCSFGIKSLLLAVSTLLITVSCQQPVAIPSTIVPGQPFTVYCDASRVTIPDPGVTAVSNLIISRNLSMTFDLVASYASLSPPGLHPTFTIIPQGRNWNFTFSGANMGVNNRNTMNIVMSVLDTRCEDAGTYRCGVNYYLKDGTKKTFEKLQSVTAISGTSMFDLSVSPDDSNLQYNIGDNITFTCTVKGPNTLTFAWELWTNMPDYDPQPGNLPSDAIRTDWPAGSPIGTGGCVVYDMKSTLNVLISGSDYPETYKCIVYNNINNNRIEVERGNITIGTEGSILPNDRPIVDAKDPRDVETFTITCDASRVTIPHSEGRAVSISELVLDARVGSSQTFDKIAQYVSCGQPGRLQYQNIVPGRDWVFNFTGSNSGHNNMATMRIEIQVRDPKHTDAGLYRCTVRYFSAQSGLVEVSQEYNLNTSVLPIINEEKINNGLLKIKCDARRVEVPGPNISSEVVGALVVQAKLGTSQTYTKIAEYLSYGPQENLQFQNPPPGRDWVFTFAGSNNGVNNRKTMSLDIDARCDDAGTYLCQVMFYSSEEGTTWLHQEQTVTGVC